MRGDVRSVREFRQRRIFARSTPEKKKQEDIESSCFLYGNLLCGVIFDLISRSAAGLWYISARRNIPPDGGMRTFAVYCISKPERIFYGEGSVPPAHQTKTPPISGWCLYLVKNIGIWTNLYREKKQTCSAVLFL